MRTEPSIEQLLYRHVYHNVGNLHLAQLGALLCQGTAVRDEGEEHHLLYRVTKEQREAAGRLLAELHEIVKHPALELNPRGEAAERAREDGDFQEFILAALVPVRKRKRRGKGA